MKLKFRLASSVDIDLLFQIKCQSLKPNITQVWGWDDTIQFEYFSYNFNPENISVILMDDTPVGYLEIVRTNKTVFIVNLLISQPYQGQGIGTAILKELIDAEVPKNNTLRLEVLKINHRAQSLYKRIGFEIAEETDLKYKLIYSA